MRNEKTYEQAQIAFQKLSPTPGDVVTVTLPSDIVHEQMAALAEVLSPLVSEHKCSVVFLRAGVTLDLVNEQQMNKLGWFKSDPKKPH